MYLSKNSRYVLQKAQVLSPKIFKVAQNNLSIKTPNDDPSKPSLRVNIPKETHEEEAHAKSVHNVGEQRTRNLTNRPQTSTIPAIFDEDLLTKSNEQEVQLPSFAADGMLKSADLENTSTTPYLESQSRVDDRTPNKDEYSDGSPLIDEPTEKALLSQNSEAQGSSWGDEPKNPERNTDPKSLYIIIDVPEYTVQKTAETSTPEMVQEMNKTSSEKGEFDPAALKAKLDRQKAEDGSKKNSFKFPTLKKKLNRTKRFDINEIEEPATYVFHLRLNKQMGNKSTGVECVPEKEVTTRNENLNSNYVHIKISDGANDANLGKQVASIEELPNFKPAETFRKPGVRKTGAVGAGSKSNLLRVIKSSGAIPPQEGEASVGNFGESEDVQSFEKFVRKSKNLMKKNVPKSEKIVGLTKPKDQSFPVNFPRQTEMKREEKPSQEVEPNPGAEVLREQSVNPEHQYAKMDTEAFTYKNVNEWSSKTQHEEAPKHLYGSKVQNKAEYQTQQMSYPAEERETAARNPVYTTPDNYEAQYKQRETAARNPVYTTPDNYEAQYKQRETAARNPIYTTPDEAQYRQQSTSEYQYPNPQKTEQEENSSPYVSIFELQAQNQSQQQEPQQVSYTEETKQQKEESTSPYFSIHELREQIKQFKEENEVQQTPKNTKPGGKQREDYPPGEKQTRSNDQEFSKPDKSAMSFQTSSTCVSIGCEKIMRSSQKFCAAFPPLLNEALKHRIKFGKDFFLNEKFTLNNDKTFEKNPELSENSILFPKKESEKFDCESLFSTGEETILNIIKNSEEKQAMEHPVEPSGGNGNSVDGLTVMKKVKEIVQFDLDNAVKIFKTDESKQDVSSVLLLDGDTWKVDEEELKKQVEKSAKRMENAVREEFKKYFKSDISGDKMTEDSHPIKYLPPKTENEMKFDSVIGYDPYKDEFFVKKDTLAETIAEKTKTSLEEVVNTLDILAETSKMEAKSGDSILVFDDETQSWKVDFSILEKREQQMKIEEELTKRSELILETFEQLEKGQLTNVPLPDTKAPKTFDYKNEQWCPYNSDKKTNPGKSKSPFKEPDAEEIRKKNSDLYENLFVANKKNNGMDKPPKSAPSVDPSEPTKKSKSYYLSDRKQETTGSSNPQQGSGSNPITPKEPPKEGPPPPTPEKKIPDKQEDDSFWETFLGMNILPRDIQDIKKTPETPKPPTVPPSPAAPLPSATPEGKPSAEKKIEESKFKIRIPFIREKKIEKPADTTPEIKGEIKPEGTPKKPPKQPENISTEKTEKPPIKIPPLSPLSVPKGEIKPEETPKKPPTQPENISTEKKETPALNVPLPPSGSIPKTEIKPEETPKKPPTQPENISTVKKETPTLNVPSPPSASIPKTEVKPEETPKKPPTQPTNISTEKKETPAVKVPPPSTTSIPKEDPQSEKPPPTIGSPSVSPKTETPKGKDPPPPVKSDSKTTGGKNEKSASASDHYVSDKIIEISRNKSPENQPIIKTNKIETVKVNLSPDTRLPSKVTEINLNKKCEEKVKETQQNPTEVKKPSDGTTQEQSPEKKTFYQNLEKYKTPFSDPDYEEKSMKIKSDDESNPNLKLDNWNKTLVLQDIMKPPENIESWLKDETDKMATLLLKVLQEAADRKPKKKHPTNKTKEKQGKGNPYDNIRKKQENTPENFLFRVRTVNLSLENDKKASEGDNGKQNKQLKDIPVQSEKTVKPSKVIDAIKFPEAAKDGQTTEKEAQVPVSWENTKSAASQSALETAVQSAVMSREFSQVNKLPIEISEEIPGPELLKKISNAWKMFPILGSQMTVFTLLRMFQLVNLGSSILGSPNPDKGRRHAFTKLFTKYGPIVNVQGPLSGNVILIHNPEHLTGVFDQDITASVRSVFDSLEQSRREVEDNGISVGIATDWTKPEWVDLKKGTIDTIMKGSGNYFRLSEVAADSLVSNIRRNRNVQNCVSEDFMEDIKRWSLEALCNVLFEKSIGFLERRNSALNWNMEPGKIHLAIEEATSCLNKCERGFQLWRMMSTPSLLGLGRAYRSISSIVTKAIYQAEVKLKGKAELLKSGSLLPVRDLTFLESMLLNDGMTAEEITCNLVDMLLIGTNAMSSALGFLLYNMAQNVKVQMKLLKELKEVLPTKDCQLSHSDLASLKYLQACIKESLRLNFPVPLFYRLLQNDILLSNYIVPKGTYVVMDFRVSSMKEQFFDDPDKFIPERWLSDEKWMKDLHPFGAFPLCHGPRAEMAKKVLEMQLLTTIAKIIRNFHIEYQYGEIQGTDTVISVPDKPLKLNFVEREF